MLHSKPSISVCVALCRKSNLQISRALGLIQFIEGSGLIKNTFELQGLSWIAEKGCNLGPGIKMLEVEYIRMQCLQISAVLGTISWQHYVTAVYTTVYLKS